MANGIFSFLPVTPKPRQPQGLFASLLSQVRSSGASSQRVVASVVGGTAGALLGGLFGGRKGAAGLGLVAGGIGAFLGPRLFKKRVPLATQLDNAIGIVPAIQEATKSSQIATTGTVGAARRRLAIGNMAGALGLLRAEQKRLEASEIDETLGGILLGRRRRPTRDTGRPVTLDNLRGLVNILNRQATTLIPGFTSIKTNVSASVRSLPTPRAFFFGS